MSDDIAVAMVGLYLRTLGHEGPAEIVDFSFASSEHSRSAQVRVARVALPGSSGEDSFWFSGTVNAVGPSPPADHVHQFIGIYDSADAALSEFVAATLHFDLFVERLGYGHSFPLGKASIMRQNGYEACLVLDAGVYTPFDGQALRLGREVVPLFAAVPITAQELMLKKRQGIDALFEYWDESGRDILSVRLRLPT